MSDLGVPIADDKTEGPTMVICFLGLELDSHEMEVRIPMAKVEQIIDKICTVFIIRTFSLGRIITPHILVYMTDLFHSDGVHLSNFGNIAYLQALKNSIRQFSQEC